MSCTNSHTSVIQGQSTRWSWRRPTTGHGAAWDQQGVILQVLEWVAKHANVRKRFFVLGLEWAKGLTSNFPFCSLGPSLVWWPRTVRKPRETENEQITFEIFSWGLIGSGFERYCTFNYLLWAISRLVAVSRTSGVINSIDGLSHVHVIVWISISCKTS